MKPRGGVACLALHKDVAILMVLTLLSTLSHHFHRCTSGIPSQACVWIRARGDLEESW